MGSQHERADRSESPELLSEFLLGDVPWQVLNVQVVVLIIDRVQALYFVLIDDQNFVPDLDVCPLDFTRCYFNGEKE